ncbi:hypothetical protein JAAARDRAFT_188658 [Jaapia argillacea MUCL 33604]|uniref:Ribosomal protein n=1 Tax=Jaapia argillacea MUCL 33604 TaxID=933084 RepID=A0A067Q7V2_9AGAM|nr:hypothetical protein JAAARDRAFT_188658 [Jaapia argillacea MUCL 33604]
MSMLALLCRQCHSPFLPAQGLTWTRQFSNTSALLARQKHKKLPVVSKKAREAKLRRKLAKKPKSVYEHEKMTLSEAIAVLRAVEVSRPNATFEIVVKTEMKSGTAVPRGRINLPREAKTSNRDKILVFAEGRVAEEARKAGADIVGGQELIDGVASGRFMATTYLCTPSLIRAITPKLGRILGPRGVMPSERRGTVTEDIVGYIRRLQGTAEWKGDKEGTIRAPIAKINWPVDDVVNNIRFFLMSIKKAIGQVRDTSDADKARKAANKPSTSILKVVLSSNQGPGIRIADF